MKKAYQVIAGLVALEVMLQALFIAWGMFGFSNWIEDGGVFDKAAADAAEEGNLEFAGSIGWGLHFLNGFMVIPLIVLLLFILSFFAKVPRGIMFASVLVVLVILQMMVLPELARSANPIFGGLHGLNALLILGTAISAATAAGKAAKAPTESAEVAA